MVNGKEPSVSDICDGRLDSDLCICKVHNLGESTCCAVNYHQMVMHIVFIVYKSIQCIRICRIGKRHYIKVIVAGADRC